MRPADLPTFKPAGLQTCIKLILMSTLFALPIQAATPTLSSEEKAVLTPIRALFDGRAMRDASAILQPLLPGGSLVLMRDGKPTQITFTAFA